ncbi:MAG: sigma factor-like helix-turn-helix DNA-binding protein [Acidimicrobiia bacterium]
MLSVGVTFEEFAEVASPRLRHALVAAYGLDAGLDAAAEAMAYGFEHWDDVSATANPAGYLYRVGQTAARRSRRQPPRLPRPEPTELPDVEPGLVPALEELTEPQRVVVVLVVGLQWRQSEVAELLELSHSTVRTHLDRAMTHLRAQLEAPRHV